MYNAGLNIGYGGDTPASNNSVLVDGDGSTWIDSGNLYVGRAGTDNRMTISAGGFVSNQMARIGSSSASANNAVTVDGHGSTWSIAGTLSVGYSGSSNSLAISNGGLVLASNILIGARSGSDGNHVAITDGHLVATNSAGAGFVDVCRGRLSLNRGTITANAFIATNGASSVVQFDGGSLHTGGTTVSNGALFVVGDGTESATLDFIGGTHCFSDGLSISSNAQLTGTGTLLAPLTLAGTLSPGHSPGQIIVSNDVTLVGGSTLYVEMAGYTAGDGYDQLVVSGLLTNNAASLSVMLLDGFSPTNGAQFVIIDNAADGYGAFLGASEGRILDFGSGTSFSITYSGGSDHHDVVLMAVPEPSSLLLAAGSVVVGLWMTARRRRASRRE
jgi:T5SS/PEP-CTERM-associated repeat protein